MSSPEYQDENQDEESVGRARSRRAREIRSFFRGAVFKALGIAVPIIAAAEYYDYRSDQTAAELQQNMNENLERNAGAGIKALNESTKAIRGYMESNEYLNPWAAPQWKKGAVAKNPKEPEKRDFPLPCFEYPETGTPSDAEVVLAPEGSPTQILVSRKENVIAFRNSDDASVQKGECIGKELGESQNLIVTYERNQSGKITGVQVRKAVPVRSAPSKDPTLIPVKNPDPEKTGGAKLSDQTTQLLTRALEDLLLTMDQLDAWRNRAEKVQSEYPANQATSLSKNDKLQKKIENGTVRVFTMHSAWVNSMAECTGWIMSKDTIGTARHCVQDAETTRLVVEIDKVVTNGTQKAWFYPVYSPQSTKEYAIAYDSNPADDIAVIVTRAPHFNGGFSLPTRKDPLVAGTYITGHFAGYTIPQIWKTDAGQISYSQIPDSATLQFNFPNQGGNSGGAIVDANGDVVSLHSKTCTDRNNNFNSCGPHITQQKIDALVKKAREQLK